MSERILPAASSRRSAAIMDIGNIVAVVIAPLIIFWFGASMLVYALNRHHPDPRVGHYTQWAAYRFYGVTGFFLAAATFIPGGGWQYYLWAWIAAVLVIVPWSVYQLVHIAREPWRDLPLPEPEHFEPSNTTRSDNP